MFSMFFTLIILLIKKAEFTLPAIIPHKRYGIIRVQKPSKNPTDHHTHGLNSCAKVRISEWNTKENCFFFCIFERKYLRRIASKVMLTERNTKKISIFLWFPNTCKVDAKIFLSSYQPIFSSYLHLLPVIVYGHFGDL